MVHGSPEVHKNTQMDSYDLNQGGGGRGIPVLQCSFAAILHVYNTNLGESMGNGKVVSGILD